MWSWNRSADEIWRELDEELFEATRNPWMILQTVSRKKLQTLLARSDFRDKIDSLLKTHVHSSAKTWFDSKNYRKTLSSIAYFSMEFMLSEALPIYSGGLGNVAGDQLKAASDLGIPIIGIGLLYQQGYFRQLIDADGKQRAAYPFNSPSELPIQPLRNSDGEWLRLEISLPGWPFWLRAWEAKVGRVKLYLLDSNDPENYPAYRGITSELYGGDLEMRLRQELILGIGGMRLLELLGIQPDVCHLNEGHAAFVALERIKLCMKEQNLSFEEALTATRAANLFTTHTAIAAGFDRYPCDLVQKYLAPFASRLGVDISQILDLGRDEGSSFNMAHLAIRASGSVNGVSKLHGHVSRRLFAPLFPRFPIDEIPIVHVTNGVHTPSWISAPAAALWEKEFKESHFCTTAASLEDLACKASDAQVWQMRNEARLQMIEYGRKHLSRLLVARGEDPDLVEKAKTYFNPNTLTLGFARRFATYKRPNMLLTDPERFIRILTHSERPVQLFIAGKAHPADLPGQAMI
ncbi:MAG: alpha-glucan family phosphorylase, partial [Chlamydiae bacterium]|nr:alpha-glucan family phosphorylase [Chlamydiota bacterium]